MNRLLILSILALQNAAHILVLRYARIQPGALFLASSAVTICEIMKFFVSLVILMFEAGSIYAAWRQIRINIIGDPFDCLKVAVPGLLYTLQNNLLFVGVSNLPAATYQVMYQLKVLTTALFSVVLLHKRLSSMQWVSMVMLFVGITVVQLESADGSAEKGSREDQNPIVGATAVLITSFSSGFAGAYFEMVLKGSTKSLWIRNVQLAFMGIFMGLAAGLYNDHDRIFNEGFLVGFNVYAWWAVILQGFGGIMVALVVKYADNILKGFACSVAIILSCICSIFLFGFQLSFGFVLGTTLVITAILLYNTYPIKTKTA